MLVVRRAGGRGLYVHGLRTVRSDLPGLPAGNEHRRAAEVRVGRGSTRRSGRGDSGRARPAPLRRPLEQRTAGHIAAGAERAFGSLSPPDGRQFPRDGPLAERVLAWLRRRARVLIVNSDLVSARERPQSILDLAEPKWRGRCAIARPLEGTMAAQAACLFAAWGPKRAENFFRRLRDNHVQVAPRQQAGRPGRVRRKPRLRPDRQRRGADRSGKRDAGDDRLSRPAAEGAGDVVPAQHGGDHQRRPPSRRRPATGRFPPFAPCGKLSGERGEGPDPAEHGGDGQDSACRRRKRSGRCKSISSRRPTPGTPPRVFSGRSFQRRK